MGPVLLLWAWAYVVVGVILLHLIPSGPGHMVAGVLSDNLITAINLVLDFVAPMSFGFLCGFLFLHVGNRWFEKRLVQSLLVHQFVNIIAFAEMTPAPRIKPYVTEELVLNLERAALRLERDLPKQLRGRDAGTDAWLRDNCAQAAASLREQKRGILGQRSEMPPTFLGDMAATLEHSARGDWDLLKRSVVPAATRQDRPLLKRALATVRTLVAGAIPLLVLVAAERVHLLPDDPAVKVWGMGSAVLWLIHCLLSVIAPDYPGKVASFKDLTAAVPLPGEKKEKE